MNWTGGCLQRNKNANRGVLQKQKAFFARARTQLQHNSNSLTAPFRPSYLRNNDFDTIMHISALSTSSIRPIGLSAQRQENGTRQGAQLGDRRPVLGDHVQSSLDANLLDALNSPLSCTVLEKSTPGERHSRKKRGTELDLDAQLLDANRKRLLRQLDWIGIDSSKPVNLRFLSSTEKNKVGRRRKVHGRLRATAQQKNHADSRGQLPRPAGNTFVRAFLPGANRHSAENVRILIGTDALTDTYSTQQNEYNQSQASSDSMLFDQENQDAGLVTKQVLAQPVRLRLDTTATASQHGCAASHEHPLTDKETQRSPGLTPRRKLNLPHCASRHDSLDHDMIALPLQDTTAAGARGQSGESITAGCRITHHAEGIEHPSCLVFGQRGCSAEVPVRSASHIDIAEKKCAQDTAPAEMSQRRHRRQVDSDNGRSSSDEASSAIAIVDEEPWKTFLAVSDASSRHSTIASEPESERGNGLLHSYPTADNNEAVANWSQHATHGVPTHISSSCSSASLPFLGRPVSVQQFGAKCNCRGSPVASRPRDPDGEEKLWQAFVFGSESISTSEIKDNHEHDGEELASRFAAETSSRYLPLSVAVSSVSSTPFRSISGRAFCITDNIQDAAVSRPLSKLRAITSPAFQGFGEDLSDRVQGNVMAAENSPFDEKSVTHASLRNNAACDTEETYSRNCHDTRTFRGSGELHNRTKRVSSAGATESTGDVGRSSCKYDILVSDEFSEGLDLIDRDRL